MSNPSPDTIPSGGHADEVDRMRDARKPSTPLPQADLPAGWGIAPLYRQPDDTPPSTMRVEIVERRRPRRSA